MVLNRRNGNGGGKKVDDPPRFRVLTLPPPESRSSRNRPAQGSSSTTPLPEEEYRIYQPGSRKVSLPIKSVVRAILENDGYIGRSAAAIGCTYKALAEFVKKNPVLKELLEDVAELTNDLAESELKKLMRRGNLNAIQFHLRCKARHRGWVDDLGGSVLNDKQVIFNFTETPSQPTEENANRDNHDREASATQ
jgi:hypothetical protein